MSLDQIFSLFGTIMSFGLFVANGAERNCSAALGWLTAFIFGLLFYGVKYA